MDYGNEAAANTRGGEKTKKGGDELTNILVVESGLGYMAK
jgi:hypothetical protein